MKLKPPPTDASTPKQHRNKHEQILTDRIQGDLCKMREHMQKMVTQNSNGIDAAFKLIDKLDALMAQNDELRRVSDENTQKIVDAIKSLDKKQ